MYRKKVKMLEEKSQQTPLSVCGEGAISAPQKIFSSTTKILVPVVEEDKDEEKKSERRDVTASNHCPLMREKVVKFDLFAHPLTDNDCAELMEAYWQEEAMEARATEDEEEI